MRLFFYSLIVSLLNASLLAGQGKAEPMTFRAELCVVKINPLVYEMLQVRKTYGGITVQPWEVVDKRFEGDAETKQEIKEHLDQSFASSCLAKVMNSGISQVDELAKEGLVEFVSPWQRFEQANLPAGQLFELTVKQPAGKITLEKLWVKREVAKTAAGEPLHFLSYKAVARLDETLQLGKHQVELNHDYNDSLAYIAYPVGQGCYLISRFYFGHSATDDLKSLSIFLDFKHLNLGYLKHSGFKVLGDKKE
ncbi:hypothetical protein [Rubritalea halochordaticola]